MDVDGTGPVEHEMVMTNIPLSDESEPGETSYSMRSQAFQMAQIDNEPSVVDPDEAEEKARLINQVLQLQKTLDDLSQRVDGVKEENLKLKSENQVLGQYIENLMSASSVFQTTSPKTKKKNSKLSKKADK